MGFTPERFLRRKLFPVAVLGLCGVTLYFGFYVTSSATSWPPAFLPDAVLNTSPAPTWPSDPLEVLKLEIPNLPVDFLQQKKDKGFWKTKDCARLPNSMASLHFSNYYWQSLQTSNATVQMFSAYYDNRAGGGAPSVRIISMITSVKPEGNYCHLWFENSSRPIISRVKSYEYIWRKAWGSGPAGSYQPYLVTCQLPDKYPYVPSAVSIVEHECDNATNVLKVNNDRVEKKKDFAVCVKGLDFPDNDISVRLVEWMELLSLLGNDVVYFYKLQTHANVTKLLNYYEAMNKARVIPMLLAGTQPNHPFLQHKFLKENLMKKRLNEVIPFNDCFYRNMYKYKYIVVLDIDEVIMPMGNVTSWTQLIADVKEREQRDTQKTHASFYARNVYFLDNHLHEHAWFDDVPKYLHMTQHVYRSINFTGPKEFVKTFFDTELTVLVHNHLPIACFGKYCSHPIPTELAQLQHYRAGCERSVKKQICEDMNENSILDPTIWRFKEELIERSKKTLQALGYDMDRLERLSDDILDRH